jgi:hypothetical protein
LAIPLLILILQVGWLNCPIKILMQCPSPNEYTKKWHQEELTLNKTQRGNKGTWTNDGGPANESGSNNLRPSMQMSSCKTLQFPSIFLTFFFKDFHVVSCPRLCLLGFAHFVFIYENIDENSVLYLVPTVNR